MNKKSKAIIALLLTLCLAFSQFIPSIVYAKTEPTIEVSSVSGQAGEEVNVEVTISNNPGVAAMLLNVEYDTSVMALKRVTDGGILGTQYHSNNYISPYTLNWANDTADNITDNGILATLTFKLIEDIEETQAFDVKISYDNTQDHILDKDMNPVEFAVVTGSVTIRAPYRPIIGIALDKSRLSLTAGQGEKLEYTLEPTNATNKKVSWDSADKSVATVDAEGNVTALKKGTTIITVTTEDGQKRASCTVSVACAHINVQNSPYVAPSCTEKGHEAYTKCLQCHEVIAGADIEIQKTSHTLTGYGRVEATHTENGCVAYWECSACEQKFSDPQGTTVITDIVIPKDEDAHITEGEWVKSEAQHWISCGCGHKVNLGKHNYTDACDATCNTCGYLREITHTWEEKYTTNETQHWLSCSVCGIRKEEESHIFTAEVVADKYLKTAGTCMTKAVYYKSCVTCGVKGTAIFETIENVKNHTGNTHLEDEKPATCYEEGYTGDTYCECGTQLATGSSIQKANHTSSVTFRYDNENHWKVCTVEACQAIIGENAHSFSNVCDTDCNDDCGYAREVQHLFNTSAWVTDGEYHWRSCATPNCSEITDRALHAGGAATCQDKAKCEVCQRAYGEKEPHNYSAEIIAEQYLKTAATCKILAVYYKSCTMCGLKGSEAFYGTEKDATNHVGETELKNVVEVSCVQVGYTGDTHCKDCDALLEKGKEIPKLAHSIIEWSVAKEATEEETGIKAGTCIGCNGEFTVETAKLVKEIKEERIETNVGAKIEIIGDTKLPGDVVFVADDVTTKIENAVKEVIETVINTAKDKVESLTQNHKIGSVLDLKMIIREFATNGEAIEATEHELEGTVEITLAIPQTVLENLENIVLLHIQDDGTVVQVPFTYESGNKARFKADGFSYYVFAGTEKVIADENADNNTGNSSITPTGDTNAIAFWLAAMFLACVGAIYVFVERKRSR